MKNLALFDVFDFLTKFAKKVFIIHRREEFRASQIMLERARSNTKIEFILNSEITQINNPKENKVTDILIKNNKNGESKSMSTDAVFIAIGHIPNTSLFKDFLNLNENGYILTDEGTKTNIPCVFACGDVQDWEYRQAITAAGSGCMAAIDTERYLSNLEIMIEILKNEKFLIVYDLNNDEEFSLSDNIPDDFIVVTTKRIIKRTQSSFKWDYKILLISEIKDIKISKGINLSKITIALIGLIAYFPLMNLLENNILNAILALSSVGFGIIILINQLLFASNINLILNSSNKISITFPHKNAFYEKLLEEISK